MWDLLFYRGTTVLFSVALGLLAGAEAELLALTSTADIFTLLCSLPSRVTHPDSLLASATTAAAWLEEQEVAELRRHHLAHIISQPISLVQESWVGWRSMASSTASRTELVVQLRQAVTRLGCYLQGQDPAYQGLSLTPDYSLESQARDREPWGARPAGRQTRARAILDFEVGAVYKLLF